MGIVTAARYAQAVEVIHRPKGNIPLWFSLLFAFGLVCNVEIEVFVKHASYSLGLFINKSGDGPSVLPHYVLSFLQLLYQVLCLLKTPLLGPRFSPRPNLAVDALNLIFEIVYLFLLVFDSARVDALATAPAPAAADPIRWALLEYLLQLPAPGLQFSIALLFICIFSLNFSQHQGQLVNLRL